MNKKYVKQVEVFGGGWRVLVIFHIHIHEQTGTEVYGEGQLPLRALDGGKRHCITKLVFQPAFQLMPTITFTKSVSTV